MAQTSLVQEGAFTSENRAAINNNFTETYAKDATQDTNIATNAALIAAKSTLVLAGATKTLTAANNGNTILLDTAAGSIVTLPAATGSGVSIKFTIKTIATSNSHIVKCAGTNVFQGIVATVDAAAVTAYVAGSGDNTLTFNRTTTGSVSVGESFEVVDTVSGVWTVKNALTSSSGTAATPFSTV